jgi:hypothetical protein
MSSYLNNFVLQTYRIGIVIILTSLNACTDNTHITKGPADVLPDEAEAAFLTGRADKRLSIYKYGKSYTDSTLVCELWYSGDTLLKKEGEYYYALPVQSEHVSDDILSIAGGNTEYETFNELACEVGGQSAWNKYVFKYDSAWNPVEVKHYKAYREGYDENEDLVIAKKPDYFLSSIARFSFVKDGTAMVVIDDEGVVIERILKKYDKDSRIVYEHWEAWGEHRYKIFNTYR